MNPSEWLKRTAIRTPDRAALYKGTAVDADYRTFFARASAIGANLATRHGVKPGDRIPIVARNSTEYLEAMYGAWHAGASVVPVNAKLHPKEMAWIFDNCDAHVAFVGVELASSVGGIGGDCTFIELGSADFRALRRQGDATDPYAFGPSDMLWLFYTSGTTGRPKGVMITASNIYAMTHSYFASVDHVTPMDTAYYAAPMSHGAGLYNIPHVLMGAAHAVPESGGFDAEEIASSGRHLKDLHMFAAPTMVKRLIEQAADLSAAAEHLKTVVYGGGPMYVADIMAAVERIGPKFAQIYGQGECPMSITSLGRAEVADRNHPRWHERLASVGTAMSCSEVRCVDENGIAVPVGSEGEVVVRGAAVMPGYWRNPEATAATIREGWLWTGDIGVMDVDGFLTLKDRSKDVIISGGTNIYPREVEEVLQLHPGVREVSVVGEQDAEWGENVVAFVVLSSSAVDGAELDRHCLGELARFKRPKRYVFVDELPKNNYGKVLKTELRSQLSKKLAEPSPQSAASLRGGSYE